MMIVTLMVAIVVTSCLAVSPAPAYADTKTARAMSGSGTAMDTYDLSGGTMNTPPADASQNSSSAKGYTHTGDVITYTVTAKNKTNVPATLMLSDTIPAGTKFKQVVDSDHGALVDTISLDGRLSWLWNSVPAGESRTIKFQVEVTEENGRVTNTATISVNGNTSKTNTTEDKIDNKKTSLANGKTQTGDVITYTVRATNTETTGASLTVEDTIPAGTKFKQVVDSDGGALVDAVEEDGKLTWTWNEVPADISHTVTFEVEVTAASGKITSAAIIGVNGNTSKTNTTEDKIDNKKTSSANGKTQMGDTITYMVTATNDTNAPATLRIDDLIPAGTKFKQVVDSDGGALVDTIEGKLTWTWDAVPAGTSHTAIFDVEVTAENGKVTNTATIGVNNKMIKTNTTEDEIENKNTSSANGKTQTGDVITYTITATNDTNAPATLEIEDMIPSGTKFKQIIDKDGGTFNFIMVAMVNVGLSWTWTNVPAGASRTVTFEVEVTAENGKITNTAEIDVNGKTSKTNTTEDEIDNTNVSSANGKTKPGDTIMYTVKATNDTNAPANLTIEDTIPSGTKFNQVVYDGNGKFDLIALASGKLSWTWTAVPAGESRMIKFQVEVTATNGNVTNTAEIGVNDNRSKTNTTEDEIINKRTLSANGKTRVGDIITYTVTATNDTNADATMMFSDTIPSGTAFKQVVNGDGGAFINTVSLDGKLTWVWDTVPAGESRTVTFEVEVTASTGKGMNTAEIMINGRKSKSSSPDAVYGNTE
ncbi:MAG: DUF11 domain-containing protein [Clostridiales Family XIII bacterium]|nr:DUF11 domain-containing protein [Clostridiales Family XIII bacterium]